MACVTPCDIIQVDLQLALELINPFILHFFHILKSIEYPFK